MRGVKTEVIVQKSHHYDYDHAIRDCGARFVDVETLEVGHIVSEQLQR